MIDADPEFYAFPVNFISQHASRVSIPPVVRAGWKDHMLSGGGLAVGTRLDVSRHRDGLDVFQALKAGALTPGQELANRGSTATNL
jgi:hypothetical protein